MISAGKKFTCVVMGDESLLIQCGEALRDRGHDIRAVVTANDQIAAWARTHGVPTLAPGSGLADALSAYDYDWFFSIANLRLIPGDAWRRAREGAANFHDGPLPHYAGLNTPAWAILAGETNHGVTWHALSDGIDEGDILATRDIDIRDDDTGRHCVLRRADRRDRGRDAQGPAAILRDAQILRQGPAPRGCGHHRLRPVRPRNRPPSARADVRPALRQPALTAEDQDH
jgi:hypothetical protein